MVGDFVWRDASEQLILAETADLERELERLGNSVEGVDPEAWVRKSFAVREHFREMGVSEDRVREKTAELRPVWESRAEADGVPLDEEALWKAAGKLVQASDADANIWIDKDTISILGWEAVVLAYNFHLDQNAVHLIGDDSDLLKELVTDAARRAGCYAELSYNIDAYCGLMVLQKALINAVAAANGAHDHRVKLVSPLGITLALVPWPDGSPPPGPAATSGPGYIRSQTLSKASQDQTAPWGNPVPAITPAYTKVLPTVTAYKGKLFCVFVGKGGASEDSDLSYAVYDPTRPHAGWINKGKVKPPEGDTYWNIGSPDPVALTQCGDILYLAWRANTSAPKCPVNWAWYREADETWVGPFEFPSRTDAGPALAWSNHGASDGHNRLWLAYMRDEQIYWRDAQIPKDGSGFTWSEEKEIPGMRSSHGPALASGYPDSPEGSVNIAYKGAGGDTHTYS